MSAGSYDGRLELTWTNKHQRLLAHEEGSYEWLPPSDFRVAEVRLLHDAGTVGHVCRDEDRARDNLLIRGDALHGLHALAEVPEFAKEYVGKIKLAYLDPPFNTQQSFLQYDDALEHSVWLTMMRDRLMQIRKLLARDGSVWVHCDDSEQAHLRVLMDEVFGQDKYVTTVVWQTRTSRENRAAFGSAHNYLHVYAPLGPTKWRDTRNRLPRTGGSIKDDGDPRGPWESVPFTAQGFRKNQMYKITSPVGVILRPPKGRCWAATEPEFKRLVADDRIHWPKEGRSRPRVKQFVEDAKGLVPMSWWPASDVGDNEEAKKDILELFPDAEPFATPKPERLMQRVIHIATNAGDVVLDPFLGSGTTAAVAHKMGRPWVGIERSRENVETYAAPRLAKVVAGDDPSGITEAVEWEGGGGFRVLDVGSSMFADDEGRVVLADWAHAEDLARATAAQMKFRYERDGPFCGRKGRARLAVVDGMVSPAVIGLLVSALPDGEALTVCGTSLDPLAAQQLRDERRGSRALKIPASLLVSYEAAFRWQPQLSTDQIAGDDDGAAPSDAAPRPSARASSA